MAAAAPKRLGSRMEIRLDEARKSRYEETASMSGQTLTQWTLANLDDAADRTFERARVTRLEREDFDAFCKLLDRSMPTAARHLLEADQQWA